MTILHCCRKLSTATEPADKAFREAIEKVLWICYDLAPQEDPLQDFKKKLVYIIKEALEKCSRKFKGLVS